MTLQWLKLRSTRSWFWRRHEHTDKQLAASLEEMEVAHLLDTRYADVDRITLVCDNLNTHTKGAFYEAFPPERAREYVRRIDFVHTPKHGSWLNVAECELSCMTSQCLRNRRIGEIETLQSEIAAWSAHVNEKQRAVDWQFTIEKARIKLKRLYPKT